MLLRYLAGFLSTSAFGAAYVALAWRVARWRGLRALVALALGAALLLSAVLTVRFNALGPVRPFKVTPGIYPEMILIGSVMSAFVFGPPALVVHVRLRGGDRSLAVRDVVAGVAALFGGLIALQIVLAIARSTF